MSYFYEVLLKNFMWKKYKLILSIYNSIYMAIARKILMLLYHWTLQTVLRNCCCLQCVVWTKYMRINSELNWKKLGDSFETNFRFLIIYIYLLDILRPVQVWKPKVLNDFVEVSCIAVDWHLKIEYICCTG